jgi:hypothetical protein
MRTWRDRALLAAGLSVVVNVLLAVVADHHNAVVVTLMLVSVVAWGGLLLDALGSAEAAAWSAVLEPTGPPEREDPRLASYRRLLERHRFAREPDTVLQDRLLALADRRLAQVYGVRRSTDPERAHALMGADLAALDTPVPRRLTNDQIARLIDRIEEL